MDDEPAPRPAETPEGAGPPPGGSGTNAPLQARAAFLENWDWELVVRLNRGACERGRAQHGFNSETHPACREDWETLHRQTLTLGETLDLLQRYHRRAPFLFFNGNTFATLGRQLVTILFADLPPARLREVSSAVAHYIAGVLDREPMIAIIEGLRATEDLKAGDRVQTLRGSLHGIVVERLPNGSVRWQPEGRRSDLISLPETLVRKAAD